MTDCGEEMMRFAEKQRKQSIPPLFNEIMKNHVAIDLMKSSPVVEFSDAKRLLQERKDFRRAAEKALAWNTDKGNTA